MSVRHIVIVQFSYIKNFGTISFISIHVFFFFLWGGGPNKLSIFGAGQRTILKIVHVYIIYYAFYIIYIYISDYPLPSAKNCMITYLLSTPKKKNANMQDYIKIPGKF